MKKLGIGLQSLAFLLCVPVAVMAQPKGGKGVTPTNFEKCVDCQLAAKRRVAVLPVDVGSVARDADASPEYLSKKVIDSLEGAIRQTNQFIVTNRSELGSILEEQKLSATGVTNKELGPKAGRVIPAELLIKISLDRVDVNVETQREASSNAAALRDRARASEEEAIRAREDALENQRMSQQALQMAEQFRVQNAQTHAQLQGYTGPRSGLNMGIMAATISKWGEASQTAEADRNARAAQENLMLAERRLMEARQFRERAEREAQTDVVETRTTKAQLVLAWKAVDSLTGEVVVGDQLRLEDASSDHRKSSYAGGAGSESSSMSRGKDLVNKLIDNSANELANKIAGSMEKIPFRVQVVKADASGIIINAGTNLGVQEGDTFAVKRVDHGLIDPSTGQSLAGNSDLIGLIRVNRVAEKIGTGAVIKAAGNIKRGDVLEWVGMYK